MPLVDLTNRKTNVSATAGPTQSNQLHAVGGGGNKTQKTQAVSGAVSRRKPKHFLEAKAREPPRGVAKTGQPATPMPNFLGIQTQASMHESRREERENP